MPILRTSRNAADCLFSTIPKGLRIGCFSLQKWLSHFGAKDGQLHCTSTCLRAARYKYLPILKRKIRVKIRNCSEGNHKKVNRASEKQETISRTVMLAI